MVSSNQRSINEAIRKVIGSSNRGFASVDPERQCAVLAPADVAAAAGRDKSGVGAARSRGTPGTASTAQAKGRR